MKTITKTFYLSDVDLKDISQSDHLDNREDVLLSTIQDNLYKNQIQISWQEPEREVRITESEFNRIIDEYPLDTNEINSLKQKLFGNRVG